MATTTKKPARTLHYNRLCGILFIHVHKTGEEEVAYYLDPIPCDLSGRAFSLCKIRDKATYHVHLADDPRADSCECRGFLRWGRCKHLAALRLLSERGEV